MEGAAACHLGAGRLLESQAHSTNNTFNLTHKSHDDRFKRNTTWNEHSNKQRPGGQPHVDRSQSHAVIPQVSGFRRQVACSIPTVKLLSAEGGWRSFSPELCWERLKEPPLGSSWGGQLGGAKFLHNSGWGKNTEITQSQSNQHC